MEEQSNDLKVNEEKKLGFGLGTFWIIAGFWVGGIALIFGLILGKSSEYIPNRGIALLIVILGIGSAIGLLVRRKFALYLVYATLLLSVLGGVMDLIEGSTVSIISGLIAFPIAYLWVRYFQKRKEWFK